MWGWVLSHLLDVDGLGAADLSALLDLAQRPPRAQLRGRTVLLAFFEPSTRTRHSFELAAHDLGARVLSLEAAASSVAKGESLLDTAETAEALGADAIVLRHPCSGAAHLVAASVSIPVINAGDGTHAHPTQTLADLLTVRQRKGGIAGLRVVLVGDVLNSRVARSAIHGFVTLGAEVVCCGPAALLPPGLASLGAAAATDLDQALRGADVVMALRLQTERQAAGLAPDAAEFRRRWSVSADRLGRARPDVLVLHPGPVMRGVELDAAVLADPRCAVRAQVSNGVAVRRAVLGSLLGGAAE